MAKCSCYVKKQTSLESTNIWLNPEKRRQKMSKKERRCVKIAGVAGVLFLMVGSSVCAQEKNIANNPSAEEFRKEKERVIGSGKDKQGNICEYKKINHPVGWKVYSGAGGFYWGSTDKEAHQGKRSAFVETTRPYVHQDGRESVSVALVQGNSGGYEGHKAYKALPEQTYFVSFWMKAGGNSPRVSVFIRSWNSEEAKGKDRQKISIEGLESRFYPYSDWKQYKGVFKTKQDTKRFALLFLLSSLGKIYVDDVVIYPFDEM